MSWYKLSKDYIENIFQEKDKSLKQDSFEPVDLKEPIKDPSTFTLEYFLDKKRNKNPINYKLLNEIRTPNSYFAHGQGGDYRMQEGRDQVWNQTPDNFITPSDWNS